jgi:heme-degrading monooxygenase HmoA
MILEAVALNVREGEAERFEEAFRAASPIIACAHGHISHELQRCLETPRRYLLLVRWETLDDHVVGFRGSDAFGEWRRLLHHFYDPAPVVEHFERCWPPGPEDASGRGLTNHK